MSETRMVYSSTVIGLYLVEEAVDLRQCVCNWQVEELSEVLQPQFVGVQLSGSSGMFL